MALTDALDDLISEGRIAPQLAMKILNNFDKHVTEVLSEKVKANLTFKVRSSLLYLCVVRLGGRR
jgi:transcription initiation factor TFIIA small subunit